MGDDTSQTPARPRARTDQADRQPRAGSGTDTRRARHRTTEGVADLPQGPNQPESNVVNRRGHPNPGATTLKDLTVILVAPLPTIEADPHRVTENSQILCGYLPSDSGAWFTRFAGACQVPRDGGTDVASGVVGDLDHCWSRHCQLLGNISR